MSASLGVLLACAKQIPPGDVAFAADTENVSVLNADIAASIDAYIASVKAQQGGDPTIGAGPGEVVAAPPPNRPATPQGGAQPRYPLTVPLILNDRYLGDVGVEVDMAGYGDINRERLFDLLEGVVSTETLEALQGRAGQSVTTPFDALNFEGFTIAFVSSQLEVHASIPVDGLGVRDLSVGGGLPAPDPDDYIQPARVAIGANISLRGAYDYEDGREPVDGTAIGFANLGGFGGFVVAGGVNIREEDDGGVEVERRDTEITKDFYESAIRVSAGELDPLVDGFQQSQPILGLGVARRFGVIRPFENIQPSGRGEIVLERDSLVDVEVNGVLVDTIELGAGRYSLSDFPFANGANDVRLVVEDETGRREIARLSIFNQPGLLEPGKVDFSIAAGVPRTGGVDDYGDEVVGSGFLRVGATNWLTVGANAQADEDVGQAGLEASFGTPLGYFNVESATNWDLDSPDNAGLAHAVDYQETLSLLDEDDLRLTGTVVYENQDFTSLESGGDLGGQELDAAARLNFRTPIGVSVGATGAYSTFHDDSPAQVVSGLNLGTSLGPVGVSLSGTRSEQDGAEEYAGFVGLSYRIGDRYTSRARYSSPTERYEMELNRSPRDDLHDVSGRLRLSGEESATSDDYDYGATAEVRYQGNRLEAELDHNLAVTDGLNGQSNQLSQVRASIGVGVAGGRVAIGQPFRSGFMIVSRHPTLQGSDVALTGSGGRRTEAETDVLGPALVPIERPYAVRKLGVEVDPLPLGYNIGAGEIEVFPGSGAGYSVTIGSAASRTIMGYLRTPDDEPVGLVVGDLTPTNGDEALARQFFTNSSGRFIAEKVAPGSYSLALNGETIGEVEVPEDGEPLLDIGVVVVSGASSK